MSIDNPEKAAELMEQTKEAYAEKTAEHNELLEAAKEGEEALLTETTEVEIGDAELTVSTEITGETMRKIQGIEETNPADMLDTTVEILTDQTESISANGVTVDSREDIAVFFREFINTNDVNSAAELCFNRIVEEPNNLEQERREEAIESFRSNR